MFYASMPGFAFVGLSGFIGENAKASAPKFFELVGLACFVFAIVVNITILGIHISSL